MNVRIWVAPAGSHPMGNDANGEPVAANEDGAGTMTEITGAFRFVEPGSPPPASNWTRP